MDLQKGLKLQIEEGIPNWLLGTIVLSCAAPAITLNVWPRIDQMASQGFSSNALGIVLLVTLSALGMTCVPFAMKKAESRAFWWTCLAFGIGLGILNYTMAVGAIGKVRDAEAGERSALRAKAETIRAAIAEAEGARRSLPAFRWTTGDMVATAREAVALATAARDQECNKVGDHCRARVLQLNNRQSELATAAADRSATERAEALDRAITELRSGVAALGPIPKDDDQQATRIAVVVGVLFNLGANAADKVATGLIHFLAICAEAFALGMPRIITTALSRRENPQTQPQKLGEVNGPRSEPPAANLPTQGPPKSKVAVPRTKPALPSPREEAAVSVWKAEKLIRGTGKVRCWELYTDYQKWATDSGSAPTAFPAFDLELQRLGLKKVEEEKRSFYLDVAVKQPLKVVS